MPDSPAFLKPPHPAKQHCWTSQKWHPAPGKHAVVDEFRPDNAKPAAGGSSRLLSDAGYAPALFGKRHLFDVTIHGPAIGLPVR